MAYTFTHSGLAARMWQVTYSGGYYIYGAESEIRIPIYYSDDFSFPSDNAHTYDDIVQFPQLSNSLIGVDMMAVWNEISSVGYLGSACGLCTKLTEADVRTGESGTYMRLSHGDYHVITFNICLGTGFSYYHTQTSASLTPPDRLFICRDSLGKYGWIGSSKGSAVAILTLEQEDFPYLTVADTSSDGTGGDDSGTGDSGSDSGEDSGDSGGTGGNSGVGGINGTVGMYNAGTASLVMGWLTGRRIAWQREKQERTVVACLYNDARLPCIPAEDLETYAHAYIRNDVGTSAEDYSLFLMNAKLYYSTVYSEIMIAANNVYKKYTLDKTNFTWKYVTTTSWTSECRLTTDDSEFTWSDHDIVKNTTTTVVHTGSKPVPVYE